MGVNIEKKTGLWMGLLVVVLSIIYLLVSLGKAEWIQYIALIWGFFLSIFLFLEAGIITYFQKKEWKKITMGDFVVWITVIFAALIFINSLLLINIVRINTPTWLQSFSSMVGIVAGIGGAILGIIHIIMPRFH
jgi:hypothetical protein